MQRAHILHTDSGIQEEGPHGVLQLLVMREVSSA
jgi:hypothetical protein